MKRVCIVGSGNWGSAISVVIGGNVRGSGVFEERVNMYVHEEEVEGGKLSEVINRRHENVKYLPGVRLPENIVAVSDLREAVRGADILVWVMPHQFLERACREAKEHVRADTVSVSLIKGFHGGEGRISFFSGVVEDILGGRCFCLMGANLAGEVAAGLFAETTLGCDDPHYAPILKALFHTPNFKVAVVQDRVAVELCGALKNVVALAAGFADGMDCGGNTKAAIIRIGLAELISFVRIFGGGRNTDVFLESCGIADLITTCYGGRNRTAAETLARTGKAFPEIEALLLNGQKLPGPQVACEVHQYLHSNGLLHQFPLFEVIYQISTLAVPPQQLLQVLRQL